MRTSLPIDNELLAQAQQISGLTERAQLIREALVQRESARAGLTWRDRNSVAAYRPTQERVQP